MPGVNSHNSWDPLEEVIVGWPFHDDYDDDISFKHFYYESLRMNPNSVDGPWSRQSQPDIEGQLRAELEEDLEGFIDLLSAEGVRVRRPEVRVAASSITTPDWTTMAAHSVMPRDNLLVIGDEIIETAPMVRSRYFETDLYKDLLHAYFIEGARWTLAPRSRLRESNFDYTATPDIALRCSDEPWHVEIMFDGAQVVRLGRDLLFNCSSDNHRLGMRWLARHLGEEYRVHEVNVADNHMDTSVVPLRPGTLLLHRKVRDEQLPEFLRGWDKVTYTPPAETLTVESYGSRPTLSSPALGMNVLSLDQGRIVVQESQTTLMRDLEAAGFTPVPCRWRHGRMIAGGFHCMTLDVFRRGTLEDYSSGCGPGELVSGGGTARWGV